MTVYQIASDRQSLRELNRVITYPEDYEDWLYTNVKTVSISKTSPTSDEPFIVLFQSLQLHQHKPVFNIWRTKVCSVNMLKFWVTALLTWMRCIPPIFIQERLPFQFGLAKFWRCWLVLYRLEMLVVVVAMHHQNSAWLCWFSVNFPSSEEYRLNGESP